MNNKLIIASLALLFSLSSLAQEGDNGALISNADNFYTQKGGEDNVISIYPIPAVEYLVVEIQNSTLNDMEFELRSLLGNEVAIVPEELSLGKYRIPVKDFATGYYFLVIKDEKSRFKKAYKFLKN